MNREKRNLFVAAIVQGETTSVLQMICDEEVNVNACDFYYSGQPGHSALMVASIYGQHGVAKVLLEKGALADSRDIYGTSTLMIAIQYGYHDLAKLLLESVAQLDCQNDSGTSALVCACDVGHCEMARLLLEKGALVDLQDDKGWSALMHVVQKGDLEMAKLLLDHGADVALQSVQWESPFSLALFKEDSKMIALVEERRRLSVGVKLPSSADLDDVASQYKEDKSEIFCCKDVPFSLNTLTLLKWKDAQGRQRKFYLIRKVNIKWKPYGQRLGRDKKDFRVWESGSTTCKAMLSSYKVLKEWLSEVGDLVYPHTWRGFLNLLQDAGCYEVARDLGNALASVAPPPVLLKLAPPTHTRTPSHRSLPPRTMNPSPDLVLKIAMLFKGVLSD